MFQQILTIFFVILLTLEGIESACLCPETAKGTEYCGTELNSMVENNDCPKKMFFCASNNANKDAALLVDCPAGKECDQKIFMVRNACLADVVCKCPKKAKAGTMFCGHDLEGKDCSANITFACPYFSMLFKPNPQNVCLYGCRRGNCLPDPSIISNNSTSN